MQLFLVRHGESANNATAESLRVHDPGLTEVGHQQATLLGAWFSSVNPDVLVTSPFRRALLTTVPIQRSTGLNPLVWRDLHEQGGCVSGYPEMGYQGEPGLSAAEICEEFPGCEPEREIGAQGWWRQQPYETDRAVDARVERVVVRTLETYGTTDLKVVFVMHADFKRALLRGFCTDHSFRLDDYGPLFNAGVTILNISGSSVCLDIYNGVQHLPYDLVTPSF